MELLPCQELRSNHVCEAHIHVIDVSITYQFVYLSSLPCFLRPEYSHIVSFVHSWSIAQHSGKFGPLLRYFSLSSHTGINLPPNLGSDCTVSNLLDREDGDKPTGHGKRCLSLEYVCFHDYKQMTAEMSTVRNLRYLFWMAHHSPSDDISQVPVGRQQVCTPAGLLAHE